MRRDSLQGELARYHSGMSTTEQVTDREEIRRQWLTAIDDLLQDARRWAEAQGWSVSLEEKAVEEKQLGQYRTRVMTVHTQEGNLVLEPIAWSHYTAQGRVDMYAWATRNTVYLLRQGREWIVRTESHIDWPMAWSEATFVDLTRRLVRSR